MKQDRLVLGRSEIELRIVVGLNATKVLIGSKFMAIEDKEIARVSASVVAG